MGQPRLDVEAIGDAMLAVSVTLDLYPIDSSPVARVSQGGDAFAFLLHSSSSPALVLTGHCPSSHDSPHGYHSP
jgi:hypothetical protein